MYCSAKQIVDSDFNYIRYAFFIFLLFGLLLVVTNNFFLNMVWFFCVHFKAYFYSLGSF